MIDSCWRCGTLTTVVNDRCIKCNLDLTIMDEAEAAMVTEALALPPSKVMGKRLPEMEVSYNYVLVR